MSATTTLIRLPNETADAIRRIANAEGVTIVGLLNNLVRQKQQAGVIERDIRNVVVQQVGPAVAFAVCDKEDMAMSLGLLSAARAREAADAIDEVAAIGAAKGIMNGDSKLMIGRRGRGVVFVQGNRRRTMATSTIPHLTTWLREVADEAEEFEKAMHLT